MADLSKVKVGTVTYTLKDAQGRADLTTEIGKLGTAAYKDWVDNLDSEGLPLASTVKSAIGAEETRAKGIESGLEDRIENLEARGRFLSSWNVGTGLPSTYPVVPAGATYPYTYEYKSGDYYIVGSVPTSGNKYQPDGSSITKASASADWVIGKAAETREVGVGDYYTYDGTKWVLVSNSQKTVEFKNIAGEPDENTKLKAQLDLLRDGKLTANAQVAGCGFDSEGKIATVTLQNALGLEDLAYADTASGSYTPAGTITMGAYTPAGSISLTALNQATATATIKSYKEYTPAGSITGSAIAGGSISVTVKDAAAATSVTDLEFENYTPAGSIAPTASEGTFTALKSAAFEADDSGVQIGGTVSAPTLDVQLASKKVQFVDSVGALPSFTEGAFTAATINAGFFSAGSVGFGTFDGGSLPTLGAATTATYVKKVQKMHVDATDTEMLVIEDVATTDTDWYDTAVKAQGSLSGGSIATWTGATYTAPSIDTTKFSGGSKAADTWSAGSLPTLKDEEDMVNGLTSATASSPSFTGNKYRVATSSDTALKNVEFTGTAAAVKLSGAKYLKQEINTATFSPTAATLGFSGTAANNIIPNEINYNQASQGTAEFTGTAASLSAQFNGTAGTVTVSPDAA